jgi:hypothetical protein
MTTGRRPHIDFISAMAIPEAEMSDFKKGDRVTVSLKGNPPFTGIIIGESRDGHAWQIIRDGTKWPRGIHKSFCEPTTKGDNQ